MMHLFSGSDFSSKQHKSNKELLRWILPIIDLTERRKVYNYY